MNEAYVDWAPRLQRQLAGWLALGWLLGCSAQAALARGKHGAVATVHPLATEAALEAMKNGGNAVDAAVAAGLMLGVVDGHNSGIGGGCFILARLADGAFVAIDGRETAPAAASRDMFIRNGKADPELSQSGALAGGVPGALAAYEYACAHYGRLPLAAHLRHAARRAEVGFVIDRGYAGRIEETAADLRRFPPAAAIWLDANGQPKPAGTQLRQPDLARTYLTLADLGTRWFYRGPFAKATEAWMREHRGLLTARDFERYRVKLRDPVRSSYHGFEIVGFPPPSSGGVHVAQMLNILEHFNLQAMEPGSADMLHVTIEAMKLAFADRAYWLGDPDFTKVPRGLVAPGYGRQLAARIDPHRACPVPGHGTPERPSAEVFTRHTTHFSAADAEGNWVACTTTLNTSFGSKVVIPGTGVVLNNQMDDFSAQPGATNYFGLVGAEANAPAPGKRPLSSMSPTIVLKDGKPILALGAAGGPTIISQVLVGLLYCLDFQMDIDVALAQPRFHHQWRPDEVQLEAGAKPGVQDELARRGHKVKVIKSLGAAQMVGRSADGADLVGACDPRGAGAAQGR